MAQTRGTVNDELDAWAEHRPRRRQTKRDALEPSHVRCFKVVNDPRFEAPDAFEGVNSDYQALDLSGLFCRPGSPGMPDRSWSTLHDLEE